MDITDIKVFPVNEERLKAYITIVIDDCFVVRDLKVIRGNTGLFVAMPSKMRKDGTYRDIAHPLNQNTRTKLEEEVLNAYLNKIKELGDEYADGGSDEDIGPEEMDGHSDGDGNDDESEAG